MLLEGSKTRWGGEESFGGYEVCMSCLLSVLSALLVDENCKCL